MKIDRLERSRHVSGRVLVFLEDGSLVKVTEQELLDFGLRAGDELDSDTLERLRDAASGSDAKARAAALIGRRAMSRRDLERKLTEKGATQAEARYAAEWLEAIGALNDAEYAAMLVHHYGGMGYGEAKIRDELYRRGVPRELWEDALSQSPDAQETIARVIAQKTKGRVLDEKGRKRLSDMLLRRGFAWRDVRAAIAQISENATEFDYEE